MRYIIPIFLTIFILSGCSHQKSISPKKSFENEFESEFENNKEISDPLIGYNRIITSFNDKLYIYAYNPISKGYTYIIPEVGRVGISNFLII